MNKHFENQSSVRMPKKYLSDWLSYVESYLKRQKIGGDFYKKEISVVFLNPAAAKKLNKSYRGKDYATDVLSFEGDFDNLGELILCPQVLQKQAKEHGLSFRDEAAYMVLHGLLHLLGYEHENGGAEARKMYELQDKIFSKIIS